MARLWKTETGDPTTFPVLSDSDTAVQLDAAAATGADATVSGDAPPTALTGPKLGPGSIQASLSLFRVNSSRIAPLTSWAKSLGLLARVIRFENLKFTKGVGTTEAEGFLQNSTKLVAGAVPLTLDIAMDLVYTVPALYRTPDCVFMASDTTIKYLRKIKTGLTGDNRYLWGSAFEDATQDTPARLHGYPIL